MSYVQVLPHSFEGFLTIFDLVSENGDIYYHIPSHYEDGEPATLREVCRTFETSGWGLFSFAHAMTKLHEKIDFDIIEEDGNKFTAIQLAPFLGLPGDDSKSELEELKTFLTWLKDKGLETPTNQLRIILDSFGERETVFKLTGKNKELTDAIQEEMFEKINKSPILTQWLENQKEGIVNTKGELHDLLASFPTVELMSQEEQEKYLAAQAPIKNLQKKLNRSLRGRRV